MKLLGVEGVSAWHAHVPEQKLRKEREVEADKDDDRCEACRELGIEPSGHLGPPVMEGCEVGHNHSAHHDVVEVGDDEVGVVEMDVDGKRSEHKPCQTTDGEESDEAENVEQGRVETDAALVERRCPIEDFYRRGNRHEETEERENNPAVDRLSADKHVMA